MQLPAYDVRIWENISFQTSLRFITSLLHYPFHIKIAFFFDFIFVLSDGYRYLDLSPYFYRIYIYSLVSSSANKYEEKKNVFTFEVTVCLYRAVIRHCSFYYLYRKNDFGEKLLFNILESTPNKSGGERY